MRKPLHFTILFFFTLFINTINGQEILKKAKCHSTENLMHQIAEHPEMRQSIEGIERQIAQFTTDNHVITRGGQITIPVVVHVVYRTDAENITIAQIQSQIDALNRDYNKQNSDISKVPTDFSGVAANCQIRFQLASRDPQAKSTTGIVRYATTKTNWGAKDDIKLPSKGGFANWNPSKYLNIYVCNIGDNILGFSSFPGSPDNLDGIVIDYTAFGTLGTARSPFNKGRTCVHEVGHWLNLLHVWGDIDCGTDNVEDTPQQKQAHYGSISTPQYSTCTGKTTRDMSMNFMDYVHDDCMFMFTEGQKKRIQAIFAYVRTSILTSDGCTDVAPTTCTVDKPTITNIKTTSANITWNEIIGMKKYTFEYKLAGTTQWTVSQTSQFSIAISGLKSGAIYSCRLKGDCNDSNYSDEITFNTASVSDAQKADSTNFSIYPNPVVHDVNIMFEVFQDGLVNVQIFDSNGILRTQAAKNITKTTPAVSFDLTELPSGYYLVVAEKDGKRAVKKLLKVND